MGQYSLKLKITVVLSLFGIAFSTPAFAWQILSADEDAFGGKSVQVADLATDGTGLNVSCNSNKELVIAYVMAAPPSVLDKLVSSDAGARLESELAIKTSDSQAFTLAATPSMWNETHLAFTTAANSDETQKAIQLILSAKSKILVGVKLPDGNKFSSKFGSSHSNLVDKAINACK